MQGSWESSPSLRGVSPSARTGIQLIKPKIVRIEQVHEEGIGFFVLTVYEVAVHPQEGIRDGEGDPLVAVDEGGWFMARLSIIAAASCTTSS